MAPVGRAIGVPSRRAGSGEDEVAVFAAVASAAGSVVDVSMVEAGAAAGSAVGAVLGVS